MLFNGIMRYLCLFFVFLNIFMAIHSYLIGGSATSIFFSMACAMLCGVGYINSSYPIK